MTWLKEVKMRDPLQSVLGFDRSGRWLRLSAVVVAVSWALLCASMAYFVAQYFVCIGACRPGTPPFGLLMVSAFFGLIPGLGTGAIGFFIVKGLWEDAREAKNTGPSDSPKPPTGDGRNRSRV
jgi:hypothetical protein